MKILPHFFAATVLIVAVWIVTYLIVAAERDQKFARSTRDAESLAVFFEQQTLQMIRYSDAYLKAARREYTQNGGVQYVQNLIDEVALDHSIVSHITIVNELGDPILVSGYEIKPGTSAKDRDYFIYQKENEGDSIFISLPRRGRNTGKLLVRLVRRINFPDGRFGGVIFAALEVNQITRFFTALNLGPQSSATLVGIDKKIRARSSYGRLGPGQDISGSRIWRELDESPVGLYKQTSVVDNVTRYYAYRKLFKYPLIVAIGVSTDDISQAAAQFALPIYAISVLVTLVISVMTVLIWREMSIGTTLQASEARFKSFAEGASDWFWEMDAGLRYTNFSSGYEQHSGVPTQDAVGRTRAELYAGILPNLTREEIQQWERFNRLVDAREPFHDCETKWVFPNGKIAYFVTSGTPIFDTDGEFVGYRGVGSNITERKSLEDQLNRSQRREAIGRLTGGVAHDFNNLLAVIQGNLELIDEQVSESDQKMMIRDALFATERGTRLTGQLLMFGRQAHLEPKIIDVSSSLRAMGDMFRVTVPAAIDLEMTFVDDLWPARLDEDQLAAAVLNIVINARDAMPEGGKLTIETANAALADEDLIRFTDGLSPGRYVMIRISDTGQGMGAETVAKAFDPFFTTKPVGQGTGLGLSMVHGFARQSGGDVVMESTPGQGTTVTLYFSACEREPSSEISPQEPGLLRSARGETILVAEDQADVRRVVVAQLESIGYNVLEAADGDSALLVLNEEREIDLLLTDIVMPGSLRGPALAKQASSLRPGIRVIFMTGYPKGIEGSDMEIGPGDVKLTKPITRIELASSIWKQLNDGRPE